MKNLLPIDFPAPKFLWLSRILIFSTLVCLNLSGCTPAGNDSKFFGRYSADNERIWIGSRYWANPLQDWRLKQGRIECYRSGGDRSLFLLTHRLKDSKGDFMLSVRLGRMASDLQSGDDGFTGFYLGIRGIFNDYRDDAVHGRGFASGITSSGRLFIADKAENEELPALPLDDLCLEIKAQQADSTYSLILSAYDKDRNHLRSLTYSSVSPAWVSGGVSLVCHSGDRSFTKAYKLDGPRPSDLPEVPSGRGGTMKFWFSDWQLSGSKVDYSKDREFGPVLFAQYTLSRGVLKLTAQMPPIGIHDPAQVRLEIKNSENQWIETARASIDSLARTATFRIGDWQGGADVAYRLGYGPYLEEDSSVESFFYGMIRKEPVNKEELVIGAFTGNNDFGFPNNDITSQLRYQDPDLLFFSGDQIYERVAGFGVERNPLDIAVLDYLRKWYLYGWAYGGFLKDRPVVSIPDDHDVYHGNLWGESGKPAPEGKTSYEAQDPGGYRMPSQWVNMVQRTQTSHLPDPYDPRPVKQNISVYYCELDYAGISFAILEDRKFKSAPKPLMPEANVANGWVQNPKFDVKKKGDIPGAKLLGDRQLDFLNNWAADWPDQTWMKIVLSQTIFSNVATLPVKEAFSDKIVPKLRILHAGEYPEDDMPVADMDSDGWPQTGRNKAVRALRKAFALHIAGDQHLGSMIQYGIDRWHDAGYAFCVPAISNVWPRRWYPAIPGKNRESGAPRYTGDFEDGFGNRMTVLAVSNPIYSGLQPSLLYDRATGYGIVRLQRKTRKIRIECWPRQADPSRPDAREYPGWPIIIHQYKDILQGAGYSLPELTIKNVTDPVVKVFSQPGGDLVYALRIEGQSFRPRVFKSGTYQISLTGPDRQAVKTYEDIPAKSSKDDRVIVVDF
jgi:alkaline phosphatase D